MIIAAVIPSLFRAAVIFGLLTAMPAAAGCQGEQRTPVVPRPSPVESPRQSPVALRAPAEAILADAETGLPRTAGRDHLKLTEVARDQPDPRGALAAMGGWGWVEESTRVWAGGGRRVEAQVLLTLRAEGARQAYSVWVQEADQQPRVGAACPGALAGLDECRMGSAGDSVVVIGRLDALVFRVAGSNVDVVALAGVQARKFKA